MSLSWTSGAIRQGWLEVTVKAGGQTGLAVPDIFYFGNVVGETSRSWPPRVTVTDVLQVRLGMRFGLVPVTNLNDVNRDGIVTTTDALLVRLNVTTTSTSVSGLQW